MATDPETPATEAATDGSAERRVVHLDEENPWPSLDSFTENAAPFFKGRGAEHQELQRRISRHLLTVLFGISGLGKTSLLQAGVFPILREEGFMPVRIRLDHTSSLRDDWWSRCELNCVKTGRRVLPCASRPRNEGKPLGFIFINRSSRSAICEMGDRVVNTVLVFDQFEEIFSHGQGDPSHEWAQRALIEELAQLIDNCVPPDLKRELESDPAAVRRYDFDNQDYRIVLSLREDYLPHLESLSWQIPSITENRFRLLAMNEEQAFEAVKEPGRKIVEPTVARQVVEFAAGESKGAALPGAHAGSQRAASVSPALLSLICSELNEERRRSNAEEITAQQVANNTGQILDRFYDRCFKALPYPEKVREVVEVNLVSGDNYREKISLSTVLTWLQRKTGCTHEEAQQIFERLRDRRLVQFDTREGRTTIELTHDVLCGPAVKSRQAHLAAAEAERLRLKEAAQRRRLRRTAAVACALALTLIATICGGYYFFFQEHTWYYRDFAKRNGFPIGIAQISESEASRLPVSFRLIHKEIVRDGWKLDWKPAFRVEAVNGFLELTTNHLVFPYLWRGELESEGAQDAKPGEKGEQLGLETVCQWEFVSTTKNEIIYERALDRTGPYGVCAYLFAAWIGFTFRVGAGIRVTFRVGAWIGFTFRVGAGIRVTFRVGAWIGFTFRVGAGIGLPLPLAAAIRFTLHPVGPICRAQRISTAPARICRRIRGDPLR